MNSITIKVKELYDRVKDLRDDQMDFVEISIVESDDSEPNFISFEAWTNKDPQCGVDYETIDAVE